MTRMSNEGKGHTVWLDNLFTSSKLLTTLRNYGVGAAGTVRTGQTKREETEEKRQEKEIPSYEDPKLPNPDVLDFEIDDSMFLDSEVLDSDPELQQTIYSIQEIRQDIHQIRFQDRTIRAKKQEKEEFRDERESH
jgi:succinate dehydrogenase/fumarate reductase flavoprotein subunit